jgi:hypothetical protein
MPLTVQGDAEPSLTAVTAIPSLTTKKGGREWLNNGRRAKTERIKSYRYCRDAGRLQCFPSWQGKAAATKTSTGPLMASRTRS